MARIVGINIPDNKLVVISLTYIYGIGKSLASKILQQVNIPPTTKTSSLTIEQIESIKTIIDKKYKIEGDLRIQINQNIKRLKEINTYRGQRHARRLPVRGQRTKTNARTKRGRRVCVGSGRRDAAQKT